MSGALREIAATFGIAFDDKPLIAGNKAIDGASGALRGLGAMLAGSAIVVGLRDFVTGFSEAGSALQDASDRLGVTTTDLQELQYAFGQAGVRGEQLNAALTGLSQRMEQARAGTGPASGAFRTLGIHLRDAHGAMRPVADVMDDVAVNMSHIEDPARRVQLATQMFGGAGRRLVGVLHAGSGGLAEMRARFRELGGGMTEDGVHAADAFGDAMQDLDVATLGLKTKLAVTLLPAIQSVVEFVTKAVAEFSKLTEGTHLATAALSATAVVLTAKLVSALASGTSSFMKLATAEALSMAGIVLLALVIDDLITMFEGGHSLIGEFIDSMYGVGATANVVQSLKEAWQELGDTIRATRESMGFDGSNVHGNTSAAGTRGAGGRPGMAPIERHQLESQLVNATDPRERARLEAQLDDQGRTSTGGRSAGAGLSAATRRSDAEFATLGGGRSQTVKAAAVGFNVVDHSNRSIHIEVHQRPGENGEAFARRISERIERAQATSADANYPHPQRE